MVSYFRLGAAGDSGGWAAGGKERQLSSLESLEGFRSVGAWLAGAADAGTARRPGFPSPLAWRHGRFRLRLENGALRDLGHHDRRASSTYGSHSIELSPHHELQTRHSSVG